jgi:hypothetical protein
MKDNDLEILLEKVYAKSGLGKWFNKESAGGGPGWDRYNTKGERVGKCGDAEEGDAYAACLSKQKAKKLGKEKIASFVRRKRAAQRKAGRGKKGAIEGKGKKPVYVETGVTEVKETFEYFIVENLNVVHALPFSTIEAKDLLPCDLVINESGQILNVDMVEISENVHTVTFTTEDGDIITENFAPDVTMGFVDVTEGDETNEYGDMIDIYEDDKKKVKLNKIMRGDVKKYKVYVKNDKGNVVKVNFGDPNMEIKRDDPARRRNFRARHNCDNPGPRWKARYWACKTWSAKPVSAMLKEDTELVEEKKNKPKNSKKWSSCLAQAKAKFDVYPCVPLDSLAITKTGPESYENLKVGQEILTFNVTKDVLEWQPIKNLHFFENAPLVQLGKATGFQVKCTPNHKWVVKNGDGYHTTKLLETKDINKHMQIVTCAELENESSVILNEWSKKDSWVEKILAMSKKEREIFLASAIVYDGHDKGVSTKILNRHSFGFSQKNEDHFYATILAAFLNGYHVTFADKAPDMLAASIIRNKKTHNTQNLIIKDADSEDVWCPETDNNTWVMIQNGFITITGNSAYANAWAAKCYKSKGGKWKKIAEDITHNALKTLNESVYNSDLYGLIKNRTK